MEETASVVGASRDRFESAMDDDLVDQAVAGFGEQEVIGRQCDEQRRRAFRLARAPAVAQPRPAHEEERQQRGKHQHRQRPVESRVEATVRQAARHFTGYDADHYLILAGDHLYRMDFCDLIESHIESRADITIAAQPIARWADCRNRIGHLRRPTVQSAAATRK